MSYTKGKWHVGCGNGEGHVFGGEGVRRDITGLSPICKIIGNTEEDRANAHLIAAAPELLEACKYVVRWHREHDSGSGELFGLDFVTTCIAAIAKAENRE